MKQEEKFLEDFDAKGLSDDFYPYSFSGLRALSRTFDWGYSVLVLLIFKTVGELIVKPMLFILDDKLNGIAQKIHGGIDKGLSGIAIMNGNEVPPSPIPEGVIKFNVIFTLSDWFVKLYNCVLVVVFGITVFYVVKYLYLLACRHLNWETFILRNDFEALGIKRKYLKLTNVEKLLSEINKEIKKNKKDNNSEMSNKHEIEKERLLAHKNMTIFVNTRKAQGSLVLQKQYRAVFKVPSLKDSVDKLESDLKDLDIALRRMLKGAVTFGKTETSSNFGQLVARGMVTEKEQLIPKSVQKANKGDSRMVEDVVVEDAWATFPLSLYKDKTEEINKISKRAKEASERVASNLSSYFISVKSSLVLAEKDGIRLNAKNGIYHFEFPEFTPQMPEATTLEKNLQAMLGEPRLTVKISGGVDITVPLPSDCQLPLDTAQVFRKAFADGKFKITDTVFGVKSDGNPFVESFATLPHVIIAGTTGSGKSVAINAAIHSILVKATPDQVKFAFVDPKFVEFEPYQDNPFLFAPIITNMHNAFALLSWLADVEMDRRYKLFSKFGGIKNLEDFNDMIDACRHADAIFKQYRIKTFEEYQKSKKEEVKSIVVSVAKITLGQPEILEMEHMDYLICVIDEYADMGNMMSKLGNKVKSDMNDNFQRLGQKARAAGVHVWLATQRPSINVISGDIKANFPSRYALSVGTSTDSDVILDENGAEKLLGKGDGIFKDAGNKVTRTQALFIDDKYGDGEFTKILDYLKNKFDKPVYKPYLEEMVEKGVVTWATDEEGNESREDVQIVVKKPSVF